ncbi:MAG: hypothetical protein JO160_00685 [Candidatus Eremiobacteraeota bacterium]|nr:hypothetical protein [Candidatus Eremiobacteraeota bacterium]
MAFIVAACGRQVTPNPPGLGAGGANPGFMTVKFDVNAPFDFSSYQYWIVFNTSGNGLSPDTQPARNNYAAFSDAIQVAGAGGATFAKPYQFIKNPTNPAIPPTLQALIVSPLQLQYIANSNGTGTEFSVTFQRAIFRNIATPTPGPTPTPKGSPLPYSPNWTFNAFVTQANTQNQLIFVNSMGQFGPTDTTWQSPALAICTNFDNVVNARSTYLQIPPAAEIVTVELANNGSNRPCPP